MFSEMDIHRIKRDLRRAKEQGDLRKASELANQLGHLCTKHNKPEGKTFYLDFLCLTPGEATLLFYQTQRAAVAVASPIFTISVFGSSFYSIGFGLVYCMHAPRVLDVPPRRSGHQSEDERQ